MSNGITKNYFHHNFVDGYFSRLDDGVLHVHYLGSEDLRDWLRNFSIWKKWWKHFYVHAGFAEAAEIALITFPNLDGVKKIKLTGYSNGAAVALLLGVYFHLQCKDVEVETAAGPRVGGWKFRKACKFLPFKRIYHKKDLVTKLPPWWMFYIHVNSGIAVTGDSDNIVKSHLENYQQHCWFDLH